MERKLLNEIGRIADLMSVKTILTEQPIVGKILKGLFGNIDDDVARQLLKTTDNSADDLIRKIRNGEELSDDVLELLYRKIDYVELAKILIDNKVLGSKFDSELQRLLNVLKDDPKKKDGVLNAFDAYFDALDDVQGFTPELVDGLKKEVSYRVDDVLKKPITQTGNVLSRTQRLYIKNTVKIHHLKIARLFRDFFKSNEELKIEILQLVKGYQEAGSQYSQVYAIKIGEKLNVLESKMDRLSKDIWDQIKVDVPRDLRKKLEDIPTTKRWSEIRDVIQEDETIGKTVQNGWEKFKETIPLRFKKGFPPIVFKKIPSENVIKLINFVFTGQMQTTRELYERLVKAGAVKGSALTYLRAVAPTLLIPTVIALGKTIIGPTGKGIENSINKIGRFFEKDWDVNVTNWEPEFNEGKVNLAKTIKENFKSLVGDESDFFQYQGSDFIPGVNSYIDDLINWYFTIGHKDPSSPPQPETTISDTTPTDTQLEYTLDSVKSVAPAILENSIFENDGLIYLRDENSIDCLVTLEDGVYYVDLPSGKMKLNEY